MNINDYPSKLTGTAYYYVRTAWEDEESQLGQYRTLKSAIAKADANPGSFVFSGDGIAIYPEEEETMDTAEETVTVSEGTEEISLDEPEPTQDEPEQAEETEDKEVVAAEDGAVKTDSDASGEGATEDEEADAKTEAVEDVYPNDGNTEPILYGKATTLVNIRDGNSLDANRVTVIRKGVLVEILEECDNGWFRIKCDAAECGYGYIAGEYLTVGSSIYTVQPSDSLWKIAEKTLGSGQKYTAIKALNGLTSNVIKVSMVLLIP